MTNNYFVHFNEFEEFKLLDSPQQITAAEFLSAGQNAIKKFLQRELKDAFLVFKTRYSPLNGRTFPVNSEVYRLIASSGKLVESAGQVRAETEAEITRSQELIAESRRLVEQSRRLTERFY